MKAIRDLTFTLGSFAFGAALGLISSTLSARLLGPSGRGELAAIQLIPGFLAILAGIGGPQSIMFYAARTPKNAGRILGSGLAMSLAVCVPLCLIGLALQTWELGSYSQPVRIAGYLFIAYLPLNIINGFPWSTLMAACHMRAWNLLRLQPQAMYCLIIVGVWLTGLRDSGFITNAYLLAIAVVCIPTTWLVHRMLIPGRLDCDRKEMERLLPYGFLAMLNYFPGALNQRLDQVLIAVALTLRELGYYAVAVSWAGIIHIAINAVSANFLPRVSARVGAEATDYLMFALRWTTLIAVTGCLTLGLITPTLIPAIFGNDFAMSVQPAQILLFAGIFMSMNTILGDGFRGLGRPAIPLCAESAGLICTAIGLTFALGKWGIHGAAWVSVVSYALTTAVYVGFLLISGGNPFTEMKGKYVNEGKLILSWVKNAANRASQSS